MNIKQNNIVSSAIIILLTSITLFVVWHTIDVLLLTFAAILLAIFLRALNTLIQKVIHLPDSISMTLVIGVIITFFAVMFIVMTPIISEQIQNLYNDIPNAWNKLKQTLNSTFNFDILFSLYQRMNLQNFLPQGKSFLIQATNLFSSSFGIIGSLLVFLVMGLFLAFDPNTYKKGFINLVPLNKQKKVSDVIESITDILQWWLVGKMVSMVIVGILTTFGLWLLNIPMALTLGIIAAIFTFIPNIGPIISAIPAILVAFIQSPISVIYVMTLYIVIQTIESYIITPLIQKKAIALPPALVIFSQLIMGLLTGFLGLALATPLLAVLSTITKSISIKNSYET